MSADGRLELVRGEVVERAPTGFEHGAIVAKLTMLMNHHATTRGLGKVVTGDVGFHLAKEPDLVRAPDIAFLTSDSIPTAWLAAASWKARQSWLSKSSRPLIGPVI